jgi:putative iron-regulated protein
LLLAFSLTACVDDGDDGVQGIDGADGVSSFVTCNNVITSNANIAYAAYADSLISAQTMRNVLATFIITPSEANFSSAKQAWLVAREPYGQTEVYRFREGPIDALLPDDTIGEEGDGPEGRINAWPLSEAIIDYVAVVIDGDSGPESAANALNGNVIANTDDYPIINTETIQSIIEFGEDERNVTTGYHAVEFLLWGQDLNEDSSGSGSRDSSGGQRPVTDFAITIGECTSGDIAVTADICARRGDCLLAATDVLIADLTTVVEAWEPNAGVHDNLN